jgi:hypothetical protein
VEICCNLFRFSQSWCHHSPGDVWIGASEAGLALWGASAYKGATKPDALCPPLYHHVHNTQSWIARRREYRLQVGIRVYSACTTLRHLSLGVASQGMIVTGWSRFNHCAALCETLPAAIPSLALCLAILREGTWCDRVAEAVFTELGLPFSILAPHLIAKPPYHHARFPGCDLFQLVMDLVGSESPVWTRVYPR